MRTSTLIDSNVLIDLLGSGPLYEASLSAVADAMADGDLVLSAVVWAEIAFARLPEPELLGALGWMRLRREALPFEAGYPAGQAHRLYRERGGRRERTLPDFLVGAHALVAGHRLLTRDGGRYRGYFPDLDIVCPESSP